MDLAPLIGTACASLMSGMSMMYAKRQNRRLMQLRADMRIAGREMHKAMRERDEVIAHVYALYNITTDLDNILSSVLSPDYVSTMPYPGSHVVYTFEADFGASEQRVNQWRTWPTNRSDYHFTLSYAKHPDVVAYVYAIASLFEWIEVRKTNSTAVRAYHSGQLKTTVEHLSRFLHSARDSDLRIPSIRQQSMGQHLHRRSRTVTTAPSDDRRDLHRRVIHHRSDSDLDRATPMHRATSCRVTSLHTSFATGNMSCR